MERMEGKVYIVKGFQYPGAVFAFSQINLGNLELEAILKIY